MRDDLAAFFLEHGGTGGGLFTEADLAATWESVRWEALADDPARATWAAERRRKEGSDAEA